MLKNFRDIKAETLDKFRPRRQSFKPPKPNAFPRPKREKRDIK
jgi:hypothetical protein